MSNNKEIKGNLARLLATENLVVEHKQCYTASFDVDRRILTLPNWDKASDTVYDMLVGHEVGHALFTPNKDWRDIADCPKDFVNVIEDARIEKLMKRKYPGLRKSFAGGYKELNDRDFFNIQGEDLTKLSLIDRINLHFKIGANALIPFSTEEKLFVARTDLAETFEEVLQIAVDVHEFSKQFEETVANIPQASPEQSDEEETEEDENAEGVESAEEASGESSDKDQPDIQPNFGGAGSTSNADSIEDEEYDEDDDEDDGSGGGDTSSTQRSFDQKAENLSSRNYGRSTTYIEIPKNVNLENHLVDWTVLHDWIDSQASDPDVYSDVDSDYHNFRKQSQKEVNYLVKEFECRKSADAYARAGQSKTGVLDTSKLHTYLYNEDIFKKVTVVPDGKNHGLIFILDWSGSMQHELLPTVKQLLNLTAFCKKVQIPFEVYAFTNEWIAAKRAMANIAGETPDDNYDSYYRSWDGLKKNEFFIDPHCFHLMNFISSRSNSRDYERMCRNLYREANYYKNYNSYHNTIGVTLSGTPLNEAIVLLNYIIPHFKKQNDLQKVNVCILTDGEGCQSAYGREQYIEHKDEIIIRPSRIDWGNCLRDRQTGRVYPEFEYDTITNIFIQQVRDRNPDVNVIGFRILQGSQLSSFVGRYADFRKYTEIQKQWKKEKSAIIPNPAAFSALYAISSNSLNQNTELNVESGAKKTEISRAFKKMLASKSTNKKLLNSFVEYVS
jgi:hypothetical protein